MKKTLLALMMLSAAAAYAGEAETVCCPSNRFTVPLCMSKTATTAKSFPAKRFGKRAAPFTGSAIRY